MGRVSGAASRPRPIRFITAGRVAWADRPVSERIVHRTLYVSAFRAIARLRRIVLMLLSTDGWYSRAKIRVKFGYFDSIPGFF